MNLQDAMQLFKERHAVECRLDLVLEDAGYFRWIRVPRYVFFDSDGLALGHFMPTTRQEGEELVIHATPRHLGYHERHLMPMVESWRRHPYGGDGRMAFMRGAH